MRGLELLVLAAILGASVVRAGEARAGESGPARDELRLGYSLKLVGNCQDALPHFVRSFQLEASPMAALNLSDCEQKLGDFVAAQGHAAQGLQLALDQNNGELAQVAKEQLAAIEARLPRLSVRLVGGSPDCTVSRDGSALPAVSIGQSLAVNPGSHVLAVSCPDHEERRFDVSLAEGERKETDVSPGPLLGAPAFASVPAAMAGKSDAEREHRAPDGSKTGPIVLMSFGAAGLVAGFVTGIEANAKHAMLLERCDPRGACPSSEASDIDAFHTLRTVSTVAYVVGAAAVAGGALWWILAPSKRSATTAAMWIGPGSAGIGGRF